MYIHNSLVKYRHILSKNNRFVCFNIKIVRFIDVKKFIQRSISDFSSVFNIFLKKNSTEHFTE